MKRLLIAAALLLAIAAPASAAGTACLMNSYVDGWGAHGDHAVIVNDTFGRKYLLTLTGYCADLDFSTAIGIHSPGGTDLGCVQGGDRIVMRGGGATMRDRHDGSCWVNKVELYTPAMEKAYKAELEAKKNKTAD